MKIKKPNRKKHGYEQHLNAPCETVFPLLCPVKEVEWVPRWMPDTVISQSGVCEQDCIFVTPPETPSESGNAIWIVTKHDLANWKIEMYKVVPGHTISKLEISLLEAPGKSTTAHISYELTSIGPAGDAFMEDFTAEWYEQFMVEWEAQMNHYLKTGSRIP